MEFLKNKEQRLKQIESLRQSGEPSPEHTFRPKLIAHYKPDNYVSDHFIVKEDRHENGFVMEDIKSDSSLIEKLDLRETLEENLTTI